VAKKRDDFNHIVGQAQAALTAKRYDDAIKDYNDALKLMPGDATAARGLKDAMQARDAATAPPPDNTAECKKFMDSGAALEMQKKFGEAQDCSEAGIFGMFQLA